MMNGLLLPEWCRTETSSSAHPPGLEALIARVAEGEEAACLEFHHALYTLNKKRLAIDGFSSPEQEFRVLALCHLLENAWLALERKRIAPELETAPDEGGAFVEWFEGLEKTGYGQHHPLFEHLAERADRAAFQYFFHHESMTEAGFDDMVALTQVKAPDPVKMELAQNYWDEMGRGNAKGVHSTLFLRVINNLGLAGRHGETLDDWTPMAMSNLMIALATRRSHFSQSLGALGVIELTAPARCEQVMTGLRRIGVPGEDYHYYALHATLDKRHWQGWRDNILTPMVHAMPDRMPGLAEGALLRLYAGQRCYERYAAYLGVA